MNLENIIEETPPTNVVDDKDPNPVVSYTSYQTNNGTCSDVSYDMDVNWNIIDNADNDTNYVQTISIDESIPPTFDPPIDIRVMQYEGIDPSVTGEPTNVYDNSNLAVTESYSDVIDYETGLERVLKRTWTETDVCGNESSEDQYITVEKPNAIEDIEKIGCRIEKIYPIPTSDRATFKYFSKEQEQIKFSIYDMSGRLVDAFKVESNPGENLFEYSFNAKGIKPGMYSIVMYSKNSTDTQIIVVK